VIELQAHSTVSDGQLPPADVVRAAAEAGVTVLALTDHDAVEGVPAAAEAVAEVGIELIPAVEMSCAHPVAEDLHILGYGIDLEKIQDACARAQQERVRRAEQLIENLNAAGVEVTLEGAIAQAGDAASIGRPHIARAAGATDMGDFFGRYLVPGAPTFVGRTWPTAADACELLHAAGGKVVLAHPFWDLDDPADVVGLLDELPFDGVECFYPPHTREQVEWLVKTCRERDLLMTASSDFHGPTHKTFARFGAYDTYGLADVDVPR
jgi:predicted metal-dependent phosphoesterase TrpH